MTELKDIPGQNIYISFEMQYENLVICTHNCKDQITYVCKIRTTFSIAIFAVLLHQLVVLCVENQVNLKKILNFIRADLINMRMIYF